MNTFMEARIPIYAGYNNLNSTYRFFFVNLCSLFDIEQEKIDQLKKQKNEELEKIEKLFNDL